MDQSRKKLSTGRRLARVAVWAVFAFVLYVRLCVFRPEPGFRGAQQPPWRQQDRRFYRPPTPLQTATAEVPKDFPRFQIEIAPRDVTTLREYHWNGWRGRTQDERPEVLVTVREGSNSYTNVALHLKGAAGSFRDFDDKPALTLNFGKHAPGQRFQGHSKISLNNSVQDPTRLCEIVSRELFLAAGVPAPKADFATVLINGRDLGLYVQLEAYNKDFLRQHFRDTKGNLYDGGFCQEVHRNLAVNSGAHPEDRSDLDRLLRAANESDAGERWKRLGAVLDTDRFISMLAMEVLLCHWDGYGLNRNNYRVFHDLESDRMVFMPHGLDQMFDYPQGRFPWGTIRPPMRGTVARAVLGTTEGSRLYAERLAELSRTVFNGNAIIARVEELNARLRPTLAAYSANLVDAQQAAVNALEDRIRRRAQDVTELLSRPYEPLSFDGSGVAHLADWPQLSNARGALRMEQVDLGGEPMLHVIALARGGTGSWRTRVNLEPGRYRFEGRARVNEAAAGARLLLRSSVSRPSPQIAQTTDWIQLSDTFVVEEYLSEVMLVCEFSGARGEAWFDLGSLRLTRDPPRQRSRP
jgi:spore coat protein H